MFGEASPFDSSLSTQNDMTALKGGEVSPIAKVKLRCSEVSLTTSEVFASQKLWFFY